jgi:hypothetical protein
MSFVHFGDRGEKTGQEGDKVVWGENKMKKNISIKTLLRL